MPPLNTFYCIQRRRFILKYKNNVIYKVLLCTLLPIVFFFVVTGVFALLLSRTDLTEKSEVIVTTILSAISTLVMSLLLTINFKIKPIYCSVITFAIFMALKILLNAIYNIPVSLGKQGIIGIIFLAIFSIIGSVAGVCFKK